MQAHPLATILGFLDYHSMLQIRLVCRKLRNTFNDIAQVITMHGAGATMHRVQWVSSLAHLTKLIFRDGDVSAVTQYLQLVTGRHMKLQELDLHLNSNTPGQGVPAFASALHSAQLRHLQQLHMHSSHVGGIDDAGAHALANVLLAQHFTQLKQLTLVGQFSDAAATAIIDTARANLNCLERLHLDGDIMSQATIQRFADTIQQIESIYDSNVSDHLDTARMLLQLRHCKKYGGYGIQDCNLYYCDVVMQYLVPVFSISELNSFSLCYSNIDTKCIQLLEDAMARAANLTALESLDLSGLSDMIAACVAHAVTSNTTLRGLKHLVMNNNSIGNNGLSELAPALTNLSSLQTLALMYNGITSKGIRQLSQHLHNLCSLTRLDLQHNRISDDGIVCLATALKEALHMRSLKVLGMGDNPCAGGVPALLKVLSTCDHLCSIQDIDLHQCGIEAINGHLMEELVTHCNLASLNLSVNYFLSQDALQAVSVLVRCKRIRSNLEIGIGDCILMGDRDARALTELLMTAGETVVSDLSIVVCRGLCNLSREGEEALLSVLPKHKAKYEARW